MTTFNNPAAYEDLDSFVVAAETCSPLGLVHGLLIDSLCGLTIIDLPSCPRAAGPTSVSALVDAVHLGVDHLCLDESIALWHDIDGAERHQPNPAATALVDAFGLSDLFGPDGTVWGPVLLTGPPSDLGALTNLTRAALTLAAGSAIPALTEDPVERAALWAALDDGAEDFGVGVAPVDQQAF